MAVASAYSPVSLTSYYAPEDGSVLQARLWFYKTQTLDPVPVYHDVNLSIPHAQPVLTGGSGRVPPCFVGDIGLYRIRAFDQYDQLIEDIDGIPSVTAATGGGGGGSTDPNLLVRTGQIAPFYATGVQTVTGWVRCNGGTISSTAGQGTERANDDCQALFKWLWAADPSLPVLPSRGTSSDGDWTAARAITLPDARNRSLFGVDGQGFSNTGRLAGTTFARGDAVTLGSYGGQPTATLTAAQMPAHVHVLNDPSHVHGVTLPSHGHTASGSSDSQGSHTHTGTTDTEAAHTHTYNAPTAQSNYGGGPGSAGAPTGVSTNTGAAGSHSHSLNINSAGAHSHNISVAVAAAPAIACSVGYAYSGITMNNAGSSAAHEQMPPFLLVSWFIKL